jgi:hypothetical protein
VIQDHAYDHCRRIVSGHVIYPKQLGHTLKRFVSIKYDFGMRSETGQLTYAHSQENKTIQ